ncbi:hypothetical protein [Hydrogenophaga sp.]|uniref:hypothetical protein n=1 Tax=Hydrogenophaga sp. TaxID=1904254 RepID=UPI0026020072|nr:hypothetical protein [Hydrogenophaga sp.]
MTSDAKQALDDICPNSGFADCLGGSTGVPYRLMDLREVDPRELQRSVRFALDLVTAHRIAKGLVINQERVTAMREALEEGLAAAFSEFDIGAMPTSWSWQKAAETLSVEIALQLIREQKNEPLDPAFQKE